MATAGERAARADSVTRETIRFTSSLNQPNTPSPQEANAPMSTDKTFLITVVFNDGEEVVTQHSTPEDAKTKLSRTIEDLTDENGVPAFRSITIKPK